MNDASDKVPSDSPMEGAAHYDHFLGPLFFEPYAIDVAKRIDASKVAVALEIAAGTGRVTRHIRERLPSSAKLIASDLSEEMLAEAKKQLGNASIDWQIIDAQHLPFSDNSTNLIVCCFGYMFVPDKPKAFAEAYRVLQPGGMLLFTTWGKLEHNAVSFTARSLAEKYGKGPLPESYNTAVSMSDKAIIRPLLENAGFSAISIEKVELNSIAASAKEVATGIVDGGFIFDEIRQRNPEQMDAIKSELEKELAEKFGAAPMIAPMSAVICQARK